MAKDDRPPMTPPDAHANVGVANLQRTFRQSFCCSKNSSLIMYMFNVVQIQFFYFIGYLS